MILIESPLPVLLTVTECEWLPLDETDIFADDELVDCPEPPSKLISWLPPPVSAVTRVF